MQRFRHTSFLQADGSTRGALCTELATHLSERSSGELSHARIMALVQELRLLGHDGGNWNAIDECITDMSWLPSSGYCVLLLQADFLRHQQPRVFDLFIEVVEHAGAVWREVGAPFHVVCSP